MSRSRAARLAITAAIALAAARADAQPEPTGARDMIERADEVYTVNGGSPCRPSSNPNEIVVCGDSGEDQRIPRESTSTDTGAPRPPDLAPKYPGVVVARGCFIPPCPPPQPIIIDIAAIPLAPAGSDADLISRGEMRAP